MHKGAPAEVELCFCYCLCLEGIGCTGRPAQQSPVSFGTGCCWLLRKGTRETCGTWGWPEMYTYIMISSPPSFTNLVASAVSSVKSSYFGQASMVTALLQSPWPLAHLLGCAVLLPHCGSVSLFFFETCPYEKGSHLSLSIIL